MESYQAENYQTENYQTENKRQENTSINNLNKVYYKKDTFDDNIKNICIDVKDTKHFILNSTDLPKGLSFMYDS